MPKINGSSEYFRQLYIYRLGRAADKIDNPNEQSKKLLQNLMEGVITLCEGRVLI